MKSVVPLTYTSVWNVATASGPTQCDPSPALMSANPQLFSGLTGVHADAVVRQLELELTYINDPSISPDAGHASIDNILDIIEEDYLHVARATRMISRNAASNSSCAGRSR